MNTCFQQIQSEPEGRAFKRGWLGDCSIPKEALDYQPGVEEQENAARAPDFIETGPACSKPLPTSVAYDPKQCGRTNNFFKSYQSASIRINLSGGRCMHVIPLLLTDKTDGFTCTAVRTHVPCVRDVVQQDGKTRVTLSSVAAGNGSIATVTVGDDPKSSDLMFAQAPGQPFFALMPTTFDNYGDNRSVIPFLHSQLKQIQKQCEQDHGQAHCGEQLPYHAERLIVEQLRRAWSPRVRLSDTEKRQDREAFAVAVRNVANGPHTTPDQKALLRSIVANEVGEDSPYQLLDAITDMSGPSWGANQIDIGANGEEEINLYWRILSSGQSNMSSPRVLKALKYRACFSAPIRHYYVSQLSDFYRTVPDFNRSLRDEKGRDAYNNFFLNWLQTETVNAAHFSGLFKVSAFARLFYVDIKNQFGIGRAAGLKKSGEEFEPSWFGRCQSILSKENELVDGLRGRISHTRQKDLDRRVENIHHALAEIYGNGQGRQDCD
jgi:hypothetical protein